MRRVHPLQVLAVAFILALCVAAEANAGDGCALNLNGGHCDGTLQLNSGYNAQAFVVQPQRVVIRQQFVQPHRQQVILRQQVVHGHNAQAVIVQQVRGQRRNQAALQININQRRGLFGRGRR